MTTMIRLWNYLFPPTCIICNTEETIHNVCTNCCTNFPAAIEECRPWILSLYQYRDTKFSQYIRHLKNYPDSEVIRILLEKKQALIEGWLTSIMISREEPVEEIVLVPVPLHRSRFLERGYNQAKLIAEELAIMIKRDYGGIITIENKLIEKTKQTKKQALIADRRERLQNIHGAFTLMCSDEYEKTIAIIVDDVTTTGGTLEEIKDTLSPVFGQENIFGFTLGH